MARLFSLNIDLTKIDKSKIFQGKKGQYYSTLVVLNEEVDQYGQCGFVKTSSTKEEREAGVQTSFLGNLKEIGKGAQQNSAPATNVVEGDPFGSAPKKEESNNDFPF